MELPQHIKKAIMQNKTSLGEHPSFPPGEEETFVLKLVNNYFASLSIDENFDIEAAKDSLNSMLSKCKKIESKNKEALEKLVFDIVCDFFDIPSETLTIKSELVNKVTDNTRFLPEKTIDYTFDSVEDIHNLTDEVYKRRMINALVIGASMYYSEDISRYIQDLFKIDPELPYLYKKITEANKSLIYMTKDTLSENGKTVGGKVDVFIDSTEHQPCIKAEALYFPILLEETIKGILELAVSHGLPKERKKAEYVMMKSDFKLSEMWDMRLGLPLWERIMSLVEECGYDAMEIGVNFILMHIAMLPCEKFNEYLQEAFAHTRKGLKLTDSLVNHILHEKENDDFTDYIKQNNDSVQINDSEYFSPDELMSETY